MDAYCQKYLNIPFDTKGNIANKGIIHSPSLEKMLSNSFFRKRHPKSTGKEVFNIGFIPKQLLKKSSQDILATLAELTAICVSRSIRSQKIPPNQVIICGGGIKNDFLIDAIKKHIKIELASVSEYGLDPQAIEAMAFGWMAKQRLFQNPLVVKKNKGLLGTITKSM